MSTNPDRLVVKHRRGWKLTIWRDQTYRAMWRVPLPDGTLSDMLNLTRAKDLAKAILDHAHR